VTAHAQASLLIECDFDDTDGPDCDYDLATSGTETDITQNTSVEGTCGVGGVWWQRVFSASGGYLNGAYETARYCANNAHGDHPAGWATDYSSHVPYNWPDEKFLRWRVRFPAYMDESSPGDFIKNILWNVGVDSGQRVMIQLARGDWCGGGSTTHVSVLILRNIDTSTQACVAVPVNEITHIAAAWRHGPADGTARVRIWLNQSDCNTPDDENTAGFAAEGEWIGPDSNYDGTNPLLGTSSNTGFVVSTSFDVQWMYLAVDDACDATWAGGEAEPASEKRGPRGFPRVVELVQRWLLPPLSPFPIPARTS